MVIVSGVTVGLLASIAIGVIATGVYIANYPSIYKTSLASHDNTNTTALTSSSYGAETTTSSKNTIGSSAQPSSTPNTNSTVTGQ